jgi:hypothetical protein
MADWPSIVIHMVVDLLTEHSASVIVKNYAMTILTINRHNLTPKEMSHFCGQPWPGVIAKQATYLPPLTMTSVAYNKH